MNRLAIAALAVLSTLVAVTPAGAAIAPAEPPLPNVDVRTPDGGPTPLAARRARAALERSLGDEGVVSTDRTTGGARLVARTDGFLTGRRAAAPATVALDYVRARPDVFGLDPDDLGRLRLTSRARSPAGTTQLAYIQTYRGVAAYDNVLLANVGRDGRLLNVGGAAVPDLRVRSVAPALTAGAALALARRQAGGSMLAPRARRQGGPERATRFAGGDTARLTLFNDGTTTRLAWRLEVTGAHDYVYEFVVDATSGRVLKRRSLTEFALARIYRNHPGAAAGGTPELVDLAQNPSWLNQSTPADRKLSGNNAHAYVDADTIDSDPATPGVVGPTAGDLEVRPSSGNDWDYPVAPFALPGCPPAPTRCSWNSADPNTRAVNRGQATTQLFYLVNTFHDHLAQAPIDFTAARRNFERAGAPGVGGDPVMAETDNFLNPSENGSTSTNNASMTTRPDGTPPRLEMFLFTSPSLNSADTADVVYHEYAHGLTNRSVGSGVGLDAKQSRALGEGWSDWYALDYLVGQTLVADDPGSDGELNLGGYLDDVFGSGGFRRQGIDCPVAAAAADCPGTARAGAGGFTLADLGSVGSAFEVHDDGEIWSQTLWDLRAQLGVSNARRLITSGLRLAPNNPSFLEARDAILLADRAAGGPNYEALWSVFAARGMGFSASTTSSAATTATAAFDLPPRLVHESTTISDPAPGGDGDDVAEPGETVSFVEELRNPNPTDTTDTVGVLSASTPGVVVDPAPSSWPTPILAGLSGVNSPPFRVTLPAGASCDSDVQLSLALSTSQSAGFSIPLRLPVGSKSSGGGPVTIPAGGGGLDSTLTFDGDGPVVDLELRIARLAHTWVGDLTVTLTSPAGTTVTLMDRPGAGVDGASGNDFVELVLDDHAATAIEDIPATSPAGGYSGRLRPDEPLSAFDGEPRQGTWTLNVRDNYPADDSGTLHAWGIRPETDTCPNRAPDAADDAYATAGGQAISAAPGAGVLVNDSDPDGDALTAAKATDPAHGTVSMAPDGTFTYTPQPGYRGVDSFTYRAQDDGIGALGDLATVSITVGNSAPSAVDDAYAVTAGSTLGAATVLANDSDPNGDALSAVLASGPAHGTLALAADGTFAYTPDAGFSGRDAFTYSASDGSLSSAAATAAIDVTELPVPPPPPAPPPAPAPPPPPPPPARAPAKLEVLRAGVAAGRLDVLARITARASGRVTVRYRSSGRTTRFSAPIQDGRIRFKRLLPAAQRRKSTGIVTLTYAGNPRVRPDEVRLRAANGKAMLRRTATRIDSRGRLVVRGTVTRRARGVVRVRLGYGRPGGAVAFINRRARIRDGAWALSAPLPRDAARAGGQLSIQFTGYEPGRIRGEQLAKAVSPAG